MVLSALLRRLLHALICLDPESSICVCEEMKFGGITGTFLTISLLALAGVDCRPVVKAQRSQHLQLPIIFIPGKGGSQIEATVDRSSLREEGLPGCAKNIDRHRVWIDLWTMFRR